MSDQIFICYRRGDSAGYAGRLYDRLKARFGADRIFMDIGAIDLGTDFIEEIEKAVGSCKVQIVLIGRRWLNAKDAEGNRRLDKPEDFVRLEIESALKRKIRVIPALVSGAIMPSSTDLPESLKSLTRRQGIVIDHASFDDDVARLIKTLERILGDPPKESKIQAEELPAYLSWWNKLSAQLKGFISLAIIGIFIGLTFWFASMIYTQSDQSIEMTRRSENATIISELLTQGAESPLDTPQPTQTSNPLVGTFTAVVEEILNVTPTVTLTPTADRTGTVAVLLTQAFVSATPEEEREPTAAPTLTATLEPEKPFEVQAGVPAYLSNIAYPELGCNWLGVAGQVFDQKDSPIVNLGVSLTGTLGDTEINELVLSGSALLYGESGFEFKLADAPIASAGTLSIQLFGDEGQALSDPITFDTTEDCAQNLVLINLVQTSIVPLAVESEVSGKGMFIWRLEDVEGGDPDAIAEAAVKADLSFVVIKVADGDQYYRHITEEGRDLLPQTIDALHIKGIQVWGWQYIYGDDPKEEAIAGSNRVLELGLDGFVVNAEAEFKLEGKDEAASTYMDTLQVNLPDVPIGLSSYRFPNYHAPFPFEEFLEGVDYMMPQVFWVLADNPREQLIRSVLEFEELDPEIDIIPIGPAFVEGDWKPSSSELREFMDAAVEAGLPAVAFWEWGSARGDLPPSIWITISQYEWQ